MRLYTTLPCLSWYVQTTADVSARICHWTEEEHKKHVRADFSYLAAVMAPEAGPDELRTICDWSNWVGLWEQPPMNLQTNERHRFLILMTVSRPTPHSIARQT